MNIRVSVTRIDIDIAGHIDALRSDRMWLYAAQQWHRLYYPYVPYATGTLANTVRITPGEIEHTAPYARRLYDGRSFRYRRDLHPLASAVWDRAAAPAQLPKLASALQAYIDSGRLNLNG